MTQYLEVFFQAMRPIFRREATFEWFVVAVVGLMVRQDWLGVSSLIRALWLTPADYACLVHFFHSSAWTLAALRQSWWNWLKEQAVAYYVKGRLVFLGDHTKTPKDGRRMPLVTILREQSETASKPGYFRGHHWGLIALLARLGNRWLATPLWAEIHREEGKDSRTTLLVTKAGEMAQYLGKKAYLVLDAFFAVGPVFLTAAQFGDKLHILTRAKRNCVAYLTRSKFRKKRPRGRPRKYGKKLHLHQLFDQWAHRFHAAEMEVYGKTETVRYLVLDLFWKPTKSKLRFLLLETSRGPIVLMTSDLTLEPAEALFLYCRRVTIEGLFDTLKNLLGGMGYRFWSKYLTRTSRRPTKNNQNPPHSTHPEKTQQTLTAIEKFLQLHLLVAGLLQLLADKFPKQVYKQANCWLRTPSGDIPSELVTRQAMINMVHQNLRDIAPDGITQIIHAKQIYPKIPQDFSGLYI